MITAGIVHHADKVVLDTALTILAIVAFIAFVLGGLVMHVVHKIRGKR
jgi:hypothetical protein